MTSSTDWQAAFGFGSSSKQQDDDLGFDPFDVTRKALADLIEKELSVQDQSPLSPGPFGGLPPANSNPAASHHFSGSLPRLPQLHHRAVYSSFSFPGGQNSQASQQQPPTARHPWMGVPTRNNLTHLNHSAGAASHNNFLDLNLPPQHNTGLGGIPISGKASPGREKVKQARRAEYFECQPLFNLQLLSLAAEKKCICKHSFTAAHEFLSDCLFFPFSLSSPSTENSGSIDGLNVKEWQDGLRALLPNININFGGLPNSSSSSSSSSSNSVNHIGGPAGPAGISHSLSWDSTASWMDPAIITGGLNLLCSFSLY